MGFHNDMLYLSLCAINDSKPDATYVKTLDLDMLYDECERHNVVALVSYALETVVELPKKWSDAKGKAIRKSMLFDAERELITDFMNKNGIKHMLLKGILLQEYYPEIGMREMSDNDIYYDIAFREKIEELMLSLGYQSVYKYYNHDVYKKEPVYNFEFHHAFFSENSSKLFNNYFNDAEKRMIKDDDIRYSYHFSNEDLYIYLIAHEYKHYIVSGTGIRSLLDCIVFLSKFENTLDWNYIKLEAEKAGLSDFEKNQRKICKKIKALALEADFTQKELEFLDYLISSGVHGNPDNAVLNKARGNTDKNEKITFAKKVKYILSRLFPPMNYYEQAYPFFYKHKYLLPVCFFIRLYKAVFKSSKAVEEMKILNSKNK